MVSNGAPLRLSLCSLQYVNIETTTTPLCPPPFSQQTAPSAVLPASLRYSLNCSVFDCVQVKVLTPDELRHVAKLGENATVKVEGDYKFKKVRCSESRNTS